MGIPALELDDTKVHDIIGCFPDANGWLIALASARHLRTVSDVCEYLGYSGPPELLTMFCCIFEDNVVLMTDLSILQEEAEILKHARVESFRASGIVAVPTVLITHCS